MVRGLVLLVAGPAIGLAVAAPAQAQVPVPPLPPGVGATVVAPRTLMSQVVTMTNQQRYANGCRRLLTVDQELTVASVRQSVYMARTGLFSHVWRDGTTFVRRSHLAGYAQPSGENIAWGYRTATEVIEAWMASPRHRANMLNCGAKSIGTGVVYAANGVPYYTQVFGWD
ncbi:CAP domain-containing protein [Actinoplanes sp. LDG1-06]|uniref:CAP domain-containing protein n=1 Tax=Paractinoplanes ovalisporus TaxID=2810368 RepID=A0ABS2ABZ8_9ACTN|nr:CAP domain-containing protein [Actinoplanes ovalisporus]